MVTNEQITRLLALDRASLVALMTAAYRKGARRDIDSSLWLDPGFRDLIGEVERESLNRLDDTGTRMKMAQWKSESSL